jgi:MFS family permease
MAPLRRALSNLSQKKRSTNLVYIASLLIFFWTIFDVILSYLVPILVTERGFTNSQMGLIVASSSFAGAIFDLFLTRFLRSTNYLKTFFLILLISCLFPFVLWFSSNIFLYLLAMAIWGLYYDIYTFASYDFVSRNAVTSDQHSRDFGIIELFRSMGGLIAPITVTLIVTERLDFGVFLWPILFLMVGWCFYILLLSYSPLHHFHAEDHRHHRPISTLVEIFRWTKLGRTLAPVLVFMIIIYIFDATFWTIGPLFSENFPDFHHFSGYLMTLYNLPSLLTAWKVEYLTARFGKKRTAFVSFLLANLALIPIGFISSPIIILLLVFVSAIAISITWPAIEGAFADYTSEAGHLETEVEGITDLTTNIGYIIGPIAAGIFSDRIGISSSFAVLGVFNVVIIAVLLIVTPKHIKVPQR